jgi:hypothetical protein
MKILGEYQNNIDDLSSLDLEHYERIFKVYTANNNNKDFYFYSILKRITLPENIDGTILSTYKTRGPKPLTIISHDIYRDIRLWWLIFLLNKKEIGKDIFVVPGSLELKYVKREFLSIVFAEITKLTIFNGRHY